MLVLLIAVSIVNIISNELKLKKRAQLLVGIVETYKHSVTKSTTEKVQNTSSIQRIYKNELC